MLSTARLLLLLLVSALALLPACDGDGDSQQRDPVDAFMHIHGLEAPAWAPGALYLSTHEGLIRIDEGREWQDISQEPHDFMGFSAHPSQDGVLYSSGHPASGSGLQNPIGLMVSADGGKTWSVRALEGAADFHAMSVGADGGAIYGWTSAGEEGLYRSTDDGHRWQRVEAPELEQAGGALALAAHPVDAELVWAGTEVGLLHSDDGGKSWEPVITDAPVTAVRVDPSEPDRLLAYVTPPGEGLMASTDGGATWIPLGWELEDDAVSHLAVDPSGGDRLYAGTFAASLYRSDDGGRTWRILARAGERVS